MNVLLLGVAAEELYDIIVGVDVNILHTNSRFDSDFVKTHKFDLIVSFGYRYIIQKHIIDLVGGNIINLHISYLPWNRGSDPNLWSFLEDTPKGVSIHFIDEGIDTGDIICQSKVEINLKDSTLATTYNQLMDSIVNLFSQAWPSIKNGTHKGLRQDPGGSYHTAKDKEKYDYLLDSDQWSTPVRKLIGKAK